MRLIAAGTRAAWTAADLQDSPGWLVELDDRARTHLLTMVRKVRDPDRSLFDYRLADFDFGAVWPVIDRALKEVKTGTGFALLRGMPRSDVTVEEFELLTWAIGLHTGVARPQGKASQYMSAVRDAGTKYRSAGGRGYSSNAELDFHTDGADIVMLACYNVAKAGGQSMVTSSISAYDALARDYPSYAEMLHLPHHFSRQEEQAPDEAPFYPNPIFDEQDGRLFSKWNRNRLTMAQRIEGVPQLSATRWAALKAFDEVLRRPDLMYQMWLQPGDIQLLNSHVTLHSRTEFEDHDDPTRKRTLFRLWLAPPDSPRLPDSWAPAYRSVAPGTIRGGIIGQAMDPARYAYEARSAADLGMTA